MNSKALQYYIDTTVCRYDDDHIIRYFDYTDFDGVHAEKVSFVSCGNVLNGNYYFCDGYDTSCLVIFCHGIGGGHRSYMTEIAMLCRMGYKVLAYDNTGCFTSQGNNIRAFSQSLVDLDNVITELKNTNKWNYEKVYAIGHSWGGYAVGNICNYHKDIDKLVVISGFVSMPYYIMGRFDGQSQEYYQDVCNYEIATNGNYYYSSSLEAFNNTNVNVLVAHSKDDPISLYKYSIDVLYGNTKDNVSYLLYDNKKHNPNYSYNAVKYMGQVFEKYTELVQQNKLVTLQQKQQYMDNVNWSAVTEQDDDFWKAVQQFLKK